MENGKLDMLADPALFQEKESLYLKIRRKEGRLLEDNAVAALPKSSQFTQEWRWRKRSLHRLKRYLMDKNPGPLRILDLGCGNGWMSNRLAENPDWSVTAVDLNQAELEQGARLFGRENLRFVYADILSENLEPLVEKGKFPVIVLAASVQYFPDLEPLFSSLQKLLVPNGEIHLIDSHFYANEAAAAAAKQRSLDYFTKLGAPEMAGYYHHHLWPDALVFGARDLNGGLWTRFLRRSRWLAPFPWVAVKI